MEPQNRSAQEKLALELAVAIANRMRSHHCGEQDHPKPGYIFHSYQSTFEGPCETLWSLDLAVGAFAEGRGGSDLSRDQVSSGDFPPYFLFASEQEIRQRLTDHPVSDSAILKELIEEYLALACDYDGLETSRAWFTPRLVFVSVLDAFSAAGCAEKDGGRYTWSDRMMPHMVARGFWTGSGRDCGEVRDEEIRAFLSQLPDTQRYELIDLVRRPGSLLYVMKWFLDGFESEDWLLHFPNYGDSPGSIARDVCSLLGGKLE
ncbi:MAG: hypothetical protein ABIS51_12970 [Sphingomonas sp.]